MSKRLWVIPDPEGYKPEAYPADAAVLAPMLGNKSISSISIEDLLVAAQRVVAGVGRFDTKMTIIDTVVVRDLRDILAVIDR